MDPTTVNALKAAIASAGTATLLAGWLLRRAGRPRALRRLRGAILAGLALLAALAWCNFFRFHYDHYLHLSELYHYYVGSKYFPELGYTRLYHCTAVAGAEAGLASELERPWIRDLHTNEIVPAAELLADPAGCKRHFSEARWRTFKRDIVWFRAQIPFQRWRRFQLDHGYNATPAWTALGRPLASTGPALRRQILPLALIDPVLLMAMWAAVAWAFGGRALCVAVIFWGTNHFAGFDIVGGGFLRMGWLAASVIGICLLRRRWSALGGFALTCAALLRIFPGLILLAVGLGAAVRAVRTRSLRPTPAQRRMALGGLAAGALLIPAGAVATGGLGSWGDFARNARVHLETPLLNNMGLRTLLSYAPEASPAPVHGELADGYGLWKQARRRAFQARRPLYVGLVAGFLGALAWALRDREDWVAAILGVALIPVATELTGYYLAVMLALGLLSVRWESVGVALCATAALSWAVAQMAVWTAHIHVWNSLLLVALSTWTTLRVGWVRPG